MESAKRRRVSTDEVPSSSSGAALARCARRANGWSDGGVQWLEHINLVVGDSDLVAAFYFQGLGFTRDPTRAFGSTVWANIGEQQFHLVTKDEAETEQVVNGTIGIALPDLSALVIRLGHAATALAGTAFGYTPTADDGNVTSVEVYCPWGNRFLVHPSTTPPPPPGRKKPTVKLAAVHFNQEAALGVRRGPGIKYVELLVEPGKADPIASFYATNLGCPTAVVEETHTVVGLGQGVSLIVTERAGTSEADGRQQGCHLCIYLGHFGEVFDRLAGQGLNWTNPRFRYLDTCDTKEEALQCRQFRFKDVIGADGGKIYELEHETRASTHSQFFKRVYYISQ